MLNQFLTPQGAKLIQKYLGRTWAAFLGTALLGGGIGSLYLFFFVVLSMYIALYLGFTIHHFINRDREKEKGNKPKS